MVAHSVFWHCKRSIYIVMRTEFKFVLYSKQHLQLFCTQKFKFGFHQTPDVFLVNLNIGRVVDSEGLYMREFSSV